MGLRVSREIEQRILELAGLATPPAPPPAEDESEEAFQARVIALAKEYHWLAFHPRISLKSAAGWPDLALAKAGRPLMLAELKTATGRRTAPQETWAEVLEQIVAVEYRLWRPADFSEIQDALTRSVE